MKRVFATVVLICLVALPLQSARGSFAGRPGRIAFVRSGTDPGIYTVRADGTGLRRLTRGNDFGPSWSPDGRTIAFIRGGGVGPTRLYVVNANGTGLRSIGTPSRGFAEGCGLQPPAWSYDGLFIAYADDCFDAQPRVAQIRVAAVTDGAEIETTDYSSLNHLGPQPWSPDLENSSRLVFTSDRDGDAEVYVSAPDGSDVVQLTDDIHDDHVANWSPAGSQIVFSKQVIDDEGDPSNSLYTIDPDEGPPSLLITGEPHAEEPVWAPAGGSLLFVRRTSAGLPTATLYHFATREETPLGSFEPVDSAWSPNGAALVYSRGGDLYRRRVSDGRRTRVTSSRAFDSDPDWQSRPTR